MNREVHRQKEESMFSIPLFHVTLLVLLADFSAHKRKTHKAGAEQEHRCRFGDFRT
jgi:hypothetical protein